MNKIQQLSQLRSAIQLSTYEAGLVQAKAYRALEKNFKAVLQPFGITMMQWALLGSLYDRREMRLSDISELLAVKAPLATAMVDLLAQQGLVERRDDPGDNRVRIVVLTQAGRNLVPKAEKAARSYMRSYLQNVKTGDLLVYLRVLEALAGKS